MVMGIKMPVRVRCAVAGCEGEGGRKCANGETGDEAGDRWQRQSGGRLRLVPKTPLSLSLSLNSRLALAALFCSFPCCLWATTTANGPGRTLRHAYRCCC